MLSNSKTRIILLSVSAFIGVYLLLAVTVFNRPAETDVVCRDVHITIDKGVVKGFLNPDEVKKMLTLAGINPIGQKMQDVNLRAIEEKLEAHELVERAECYKTQNGGLNLSIVERVPVMRVMAEDGDNYYVAGDGQLMQNTGYTCNLMVATGSISRPFAQRVLSVVGRIVMADDFWRNQVVQLNVLPDSTIELVPRVGEHILYLGRPVGVTRKLERLRKFYKYGLSHAGWNRYERISVEFDNQIVCKKRKS